MAGRAKRRRYSRTDLLRLGRYRTFQGPALSQIAFPLGGIGTGTISLGGYGQLRDWEIFNRPSKGRVLPYTFFAIRAKPRKEPAVTRILEARRHPPYHAAGGLNPAEVMGLPRLASARFKACYPVATVTFQDDDLPVRVRLRAWNPFIPLNDKDSGLPLAILQYAVRNPGPKPVKVTVVGSLQNAVGLEGRGPEPTCCASPTPLGLGGNRNLWVREAKLAGLKMNSTRYTPDQGPFGTMALATTHTGETTYLTEWAEPGWWDAMQRFWDDLCDDGRLDNSRAACEPSPDGQTHQGSLGCLAVIRPGQTERFTFLIGWHFPSRVNIWNSQSTVAGKIIRNWYATQFDDAWDVCGYAAGNLDRLDVETRSFVRTLNRSTLPAHVIDAVSSQASTLRTNTCLRSDDGRFYGFEGCTDNCGCCPMNCTHVWNYEQTVAYLFPALERTMRDTDFEHNTEDDGFMAFRTLIPLCEDTRGSGETAAADGQMGCILKLYREWQLSGDRDWLARVYPHAKRALEYAFNRPDAWDADQDGVMEGIQHNTYDIEFHGPNMMMGALYLGALRAMAKMADELNDRGAAEHYRKLFKSGAAKANKLLWNGRYYVQTGVDVKRQKYQYGRGCLTDHLLGQWFCRVVGLGRLLPRRRIRRALRSVFKHNFRPALTDHESVQRTYALNDEAGLLLCTWPKGGRPPFPFPYADEVWTGCEYQMASHLIYEGLVRRGLTLVKAVRDRHDGARRNPWNEPECGSHYARAMSSWSVLLALSGFRYSAPAQTIGFGPRVYANDFRCFFSCDSAWGQFAQRVKKGRLLARLDVRYGQLSLRRIELAWPGPGKPPKKMKVTATAAGQALDARLTRNGRTLTIDLAKPTTILRDQSLAIRMRQ